MYLSVAGRVFAAMEELDCHSRHTSDEDATDDDGWDLPPAQCILHASEIGFDLDVGANELTIIMSTSVGESSPHLVTVLRALGSLQANVALHWCKKILVFDKVPSPGENEQMKKNKRL